MCRTLPCCMQPWSTSSCTAYLTVLMFTGMQAWQRRLAHGSSACRAMGCLMLTKQVSAMLGQASESSSCISLCVVCVTECGVTPTDKRHAGVQCVTEEAGELAARHAAVHNHADSKVVELEVHWQMDCSSLCRCLLDLVLVRDGCKTDGR